ncbi:hypothetical protein [Amycolatopsis sp. WAC 04169]|uniref:hypothetical protein n=1 Tax=Amycolatopsis sp. WAC 04169 TaxID=2203197 RepID=UPI0018F64E55|nr:hypothetical protein [Amycolatopsis sp. WAC 04169]
MTGNRSLRKLIDLRSTAQWSFFPVVTAGEVTEIRGVRAWVYGWADALLVRHSSDAAALRVNPDDEIVWQQDGGLAEVVDRLNELPPPKSSHSPSLAIGHARRLLWIPGRSL